MQHDSSARIIAGLTDLVRASSPGARLPSTRALVAQYEASPVTVQKALRVLAARGLIDSRPGSGTFVLAPRASRPADYSWQTAALRPQSTVSSRAPTTMRTASNDVIALHAGYPDRELLPERLVRAAITRASRSDAAFVRPPVAGLPELQTWFAAELAASTPLGVAPAAAREVTILPGSQSGLTSVFRALVGRGQPLLMESPTYWGAITAAAQVGVRIVPIPSGTHGPDPAVVARAFDESGARAFYAQPNYANPTGAQWSRDLAAQILDIARSRSAFVIEDDWAHDFGIDTEVTPLAAHDDGGHVVYIRSLTKSVSPSIRVAAVIARGPASDRIRSDRVRDSMYVSGVLQAAALDVVTQPGWSTHRRGLRQQLAQRRDLLVSSLSEHAPSAYIEGVPRGGLNLWLRLPDEVDLTRLARECESDGLLIAPGDEWYPAEPAGPRIRLNYSGPNPTAFVDGARILGRHLP